MKKIFYFILLSLSFASPSMSMPVNRLNTALIDKVIETNSHLGELWPGFTIPPVLFYFRDEQVQVLFNANFTPTGFTAITHGREKLYYRKTNMAAPNDHFAFSYNFQGKKVTLWNIYGFADIKSETDILFHESFHIYQDNRFIIKNRVSAPPAALSTETIAAYYLEDMLIKTALLTSGSERQETMRDFVCFRQSRYKNERSAVTGYEEYKETIEGTAQYVGLKSTIQPGLNAADAAAILIYPAMEERAMSGMFAYAQRNEPRFYDTGAAQMLMLDSINTPWKQRLEKGESIFSVVKDYFPGNNCGSRIRAMRTQYDWESLVKIAGENTVTANIQDTAIATNLAENPAGRKLAIQAPPDVFSAHPPQSYGPTIKLAENKTLYTFADLDVPETNKFRLQVKNMPLTCAQSTETFKVKNSTVYATVYEVTFSADSSLTLTLDGKSTTEQTIGQKQIPFKSIEIKNARIALRAMRGGTIQQTGNILRVAFDANK